MASMVKSGLYVIYGRIFANLADSFAVRVQNELDKFDYKCSITNQSNFRTDCVISNGKETFKAKLSSFSENPNCINSDIFKLRIRNDTSNR